jgi:hypothetical protein
MMSKDQQLLEEAYSQVHQLDESMIMDAFNWIASITGANTEMLYTLYIKDIINELIGLGLGLAVVAAAAVMYVAAMLKLNLPKIKERMRQSKIGKQVAELIDKHGTDPEIVEILKTFRELKGDRSKEATAKRKEFGLALKSKIEYTGVFDKGDAEAVDKGVKALKDNY